MPVAVCILVLRHVVSSFRGPSPVLCLDSATIKAAHLGRIPKTPLHRQRHQRPGHRRRARGRRLGGGMARGRGGEAAALWAPRPTPLTRGTPNGNFRVPKQVELGYGFLKEPKKGVGRLPTVLKGLYQGAYTTYLPTYLSIDLSIYWGLEHPEGTWWWPAASSSRPTRRSRASAASRGPSCRRPSTGGRRTSLGGASEAKEGFGRLRGVAISFLRGALYKECKQTIMHVRICIYV